MSQVFDPPFDISYRRATVKAMRRPSMRGDEFRRPSMRGDAFLVVGVNPGPGAAVMRPTLRQPYNPVTVLSAPPPIKVPFPSHRSTLARAPSVPTARFPSRMPAKRKFDPGIGTTLLIAGGSFLAGLVLGPMVAGALGFTRKRGPSPVETYVREHIPF